MKGMSTVIATVLMLMITVAMAGVAYMYIVGTSGLAPSRPTACTTICIDRGFDYADYDSITLNSGTCTCGRCVNHTISGFVFKECSLNDPFMLIGDDC